VSRNRKCIFIPINTAKGYYPSYKCDNENSPAKVMAIRNNKKEAATE
jgi:hypothetical protein